MLSRPRKDKHPASALTWLQHLPPKYRRFLIGLVALTILFLTYRHSGHSEDSRVWQGWPGQLEPGDTRRRPSWGALRAQGAKRLIAENLRTDRRYLLSFPNLGWNNQVIEMFTLIHLAHYSDRIPILTPFWPHYHHYNENTGQDLPVSEVFDLHLLRGALEDRPIVEMHELKLTQGVQERWRRIRDDGEFSTAPGDWIEPSEGKAEKLRCWSFYNNVGAVPDDPAFRMNATLDLIPLPTELFDPGRNSWKVSLSKTAAFLKQTHTAIPKSSLETMTEFTFDMPEGGSHPPDNQLSCLDSAYWFVDQPGRYDLHDEYRSGLGTWASVGRFMRFRPELTELADRVVERLLGEKGAPYIAIHIRRGDFGPEWLTLEPKHFAYVAWQLKQSIWESKGIKIKHVLVTTDEKDPVWLQPLLDYGFIISRHDHLGLYGEDTWLPVIIDSIILAQATGLVGMRTSTMSILAYLRCKEWHQGLARFMSPSYAHPVPEGWKWSWDVI